MFIEEHMNEFRLDTMCRVLEVKESGFYTWRRRQPSMRSRQDIQLTECIQKIYSEHYGRYGAPRIHATLHREGIACSKKRIARLMKDAGLIGKTRRKFVKTTVRDTSHAVHQNLLDRDFNPQKPNDVWAGDITYIPTKQGFIYLAVILDLYARVVVGWAMDSSIDSELTLGALQMAVSQRNPPSKLLYHSDQGSQYTSTSFQTALEQQDLTCSMSRVGQCWDNAVVESFFETLKRELICKKVFDTHGEARQAIFEFIEVYYNRKRLHSTLGYLTPLEADSRSRVA
jgi:putative transposase